MEVFKNNVSLETTPTDDTHITNKGYVDSKSKTISWEDYQALSETEKNNGTTYYIPDIPEPNTNIYYSTDEMVIGTWIDDRTLYRKTFSTTMPETITDGTTSTNKIDLSSLNINEVVNINSIAKKDSLYVPLQYVWHSGESTIYHSTITYNASDKSLEISTNGEAWSNVLVYVTIEYTKAE